MLIISSCTGDKDSNGFASILSRQEIDDLRVSGRLKEESKNGRPARDLYTGQQHKQLFVGVDMLRNKYGASVCTVNIVSAAYGLVSEMQTLLPYEATFKEKGINPKVRGKELNIAQDISQRMVGFPIVFFLLGKEYMRSISSPLVPTDGQKLVFFGPSSASLPATEGILVPIISKGSGNISIKGRAFRWLAAGMLQETTAPAELMSDTAHRISILIEKGRRTCNV